MDQLGQLLMGKQQPPLLALLLAILLVGLGRDLELQLTIQNQQLHRLTLLDHRLQRLLHQLLDRLLDLDILLVLLLVLGLLLNLINL